MRRLRPLLVLALVLAGSRALLGQTASEHAPTDRTVRVRVVDSAGVPVAESDVQLLHGLGAPVARGATDSLGRRTFVLPLRPGEYSVAVRKVGHRRVDRFFTVDSASTYALALVAPRLPEQLATVTISEEGDLKRRRLSIDADAIAAGAAKLRDGVDIIARLRPDMVYGLGGPRLPRCEPLRNVWVNGAWIRFPGTDPRFAAERSVAVRNTRSTQVRFPGLQGSREPQPIRGRGAIPTDIGSVLTSIKPEHIAEMTFHDCNDLSVQKAGATSALFIVLKDGVGYRPGIGSYIVDAPARAASAVQPTNPEPPTTPRAVAALPRVLGVFDLDTGDPLGGADVVDVMSGWKAATTPTGTVSLAFLGGGQHRVRIDRAGYRSEEITVTLSPADSTPITMLLSKAAAATSRLP